MTRSVLSLKRRGATTLEAVIVLTVLLFVIVAILVLGMTVFRFQQVAALAREGARWTSVRGEYASMESGQSVPSEEDIIRTAVLPFSAGMDPAQVQVTVEWVNAATGVATPWDESRPFMRSVNDNGQYVTNTVRVTVSYPCTPGFIGEPWRVESVTAMPISQ